MKREFLSPLPSTPVTIGDKVAPPKPPAQPEWKPHTTPGFEINAKGQLRTSEHKPPTEKQPDPKAPLVGALPAWQTQCYRNNFNYLLYRRSSAEHKDRSLIWRGIARGWQPANSPQSTNDRTIRACTPCDTPDEARWLP